MVELQTGTSEFDQNPEREKPEIEKKFTLEDRNYFDFLKNGEHVAQIEQIYLSHPSEKYSLRLRSTTLDGRTAYSATLKQNDRIVPNGLIRLETPTAISQEAYEFFQRGNYPRLHKLRATPVPDVTIDWIEGYDDPIVEIENIGTNPEAQLFYQQYRSLLVDRTGSDDVDNESIAYRLAGREKDELLPAPTAEKIAAEILAYRSIGIKNVVVTINGRSGSGKTTVARRVESLLRNAQPDQRLTATLLSVDDYHRGKEWLERQAGTSWVNWDSEVVYNTGALAFDIWQLQQGHPIAQRRFDFDQQEPCTVDAVLPGEVIIVEGIHAGSPDLAKLRTIHFEINTPLATSIGHDLNRMRQGDRPGLVEDRLRYQIEQAERAYQLMEKPGPNRLPGGWFGAPQAGRTALKQTVIPPSPR